MSSQEQKKQHFYERGLKRGHHLAGPTIEDGRGYYHDAARGIAHALGCEYAEVVARVVVFHRERLEAVPDATRYPELRGYRDLIAQEERGLHDSGIDDDTIALAQTLAFWRDTRLLQETGRAWHVAPQTEKCRVLYVPHTDRGALHFKNVDDPRTYWQPLPPLQNGSLWPHAHPLFFDGVGSGLHLDEMPPEIFPADARSLCLEHCTTVEEATEFLVRYNYFWSGQNLLIHDQKGNSAAFEKTRCRVAVRGPNAQGINFVTGMGALDPDISAFQKQQRSEYLEQTGQSWDDSPDGCFWTLSENTWRNMAHNVEELSLNPSWENAKQLMEQRDPNGPMCLTGEKSHPDEEHPGCTLFMEAWEMDNSIGHRRQWRGERPAYLDTPEIVQYAAPQENSS